MAKKDSLEERVAKASKISFLDIVEEFDVLLIADYHPNKQIKEHLAQSIPELIKMGITNYGAEAKISDAEEYKKISKQKGIYIPTRKIDFGPGGEEFKKLVYDMAFAGLQVYPFDPRRVTPEKYKTEENQFLNPKAEKDMADIIKNHIELYGRGVVLVGAFHTQRGNEVLIDKLEEQGLKCITVGYFGGATSGKHRLEIAAQNVGREQEEFMLDNSDKSVPPGYDYILHLPQEITPRQYISMETASFLDKSI